MIPHTNISWQYAMPLLSWLIGGAIFLAVIARYAARSRRTREEHYCKTPMVQMYATDIGRDWTCPKCGLVWTYGSDGWWECD